MAISVGDQIPNVSFTTMTDEGPKPLAYSELFEGKRVALFAVPGAFTPTCSLQHLPGFVNKAEELTDKGVDTVACMSVNDVFVMDAWGKAHNVQNKILMVADYNSNFTKKIGAELDLNKRGLGIRSSRYTMLIEKGRVVKISEEEVAGKCERTAAENFLKEI